MNDFEKAARMALEALEGCEDVTADVLKAIAALRQALEQPAQQESVGYVYSVHGERIKNACIEPDVPNGTALYTRPQAREPLKEVGLTRDTNGMCIVTINGREAIRDNGDVISHFATLDWFDRPQASVDWEAVAADQAMTIAMLKAERKPWVGLTSEEITTDAIRTSSLYMKQSPHTPQSIWLALLMGYARAIEAKLKEKNT